MAITHRQSRIARQVPGTRIAGMGLNTQQIQGGESVRIRIRIIGDDKPELKEPTKTKQKKRKARWLWLRKG